MQMAQLSVGLRLHGESVSRLLVIVAVIGLVPFPVLYVGLHDDTLQVLQGKSRCQLYVKNKSVIYSI